MKKNNEQLIRVFLNTELKVNALHKLLDSHGIYSTIENELKTGIKARITPNEIKLFNLFIYKSDLLRAEPFIKAFNKNQE